MHLDEQLLVVRVQASDPVAFEVIFRTYYDELVAVAERVTHSRTGAEDVAQEVFLSIWAARKRWHVSATLRGYLRRAARNVALRQTASLRAAHVEVRTTAPGVAALSAESKLVDHRPTPDQDAEAGALAAEIMRVTASLPRRPREVFLLSRAGGLTIRNIADRLRLAPKTVEMHLQRALTALRSALADWRSG